MRNHAQSDQGCNKKFLRLSVLKGFLPAGEIRRRLSVDEGKCNLLAAHRTRAVHFESEFRARGLVVGLCRKFDVVDPLASCDVTKTNDNLLSNGRDRQPNDITITKRGLALRRYRICTVNYIGITAFYDISGPLTSLAAISISVVLPDLEWNCRKNPRSLGFVP